MNSTYFWWHVFGQLCSDDDDDDDDSARQTREKNQDTMSA